MLLELAAFYCSRPAKIHELKILYHFRKEREKKAGHIFRHLEEEQYEWVAEKLNKDVSIIKPVIEKWIFKKPVKFLPSCSYKNAAALIKKLQKKGILTAIYSDYKAGDKLKAMKIWPDMIVASTDPAINSLKPNANGINLILNTLQVLPQHCIFIGDRYSRDGLCAKNAGVPYISVPGKLKSKEKFFLYLSELI